MYAPQERYRALSIASRVEAADPHELVAILYEELLRALDITRAGLTQGKPAASRSGQERASSILLALQASLDFERGGEVAGSLSHIYRAMQKELALSARTGDAQRLEALREAAADLLGAWTRIGMRRAA